MFHALLKMLLIGSLLGLTLQPALAETAHQQDPMIYEMVSPFGFEQTNQIIQAGIIAEGWKVPKQYDWQAIAKAGGHDPGPFSMYDLCKAPYAAGILKHEHLRFVSTLMPCATSVYTKSDGKTYVAYMNVDLLGKMFGQELAQIAQQAGQSRARVLSGLHLQ